jgi:SAM-dependent methyltransferase
VSRGGTSRVTPGLSGPELDAMRHAENYHRWILDRFRPHVRGAVLEVGAGIGNFSAHLAREAHDRLILLEPAPALVERLRERFTAFPSVEIHGTDLRGWVEQHAARPVDTIVSVNVLEHIEDDRGVVRLMSSILKPGGTVLLLVPALPALYGSLDAAFGHRRRYRRAALLGLLTDAGLAVRHVRYVNVVGVLGWFVAGRVLRRRSLDAATVRIVDAVLIRLTRRLERQIDPPFGQSLVAVAERPRLSVPAAPP